MEDDIDLGQRPDTYFRPQRLERYLLSKVKGAALRRRLQSLLDDGRHAEAKALLGAEGVPVEIQKGLEAVHPVFMGGNYLPDLEAGEVEIARIRIASSTHDVTAVYARADSGVIRYRVVDEYDGETLVGPPELESIRPLTLGELADFLLGAWSLIEVIEMNREGGSDVGLEFFVAESEFYPELDRLCRQRVLEHFGDFDPEEEDAEEDDWS